MTSKTPKHIPNNSQSQVKKTGGVKKVTSTFKERVEDRLSDAYESKESLEVLGENFVENRVYLLRHYPYIEDDNYKEYTYLLKKVQDGEVLSKEDLKKFQDLEKKIKIYDNLDDIPDNVANIIKNIFSNDVQLFYCTNGKERVKITGNNLKDYYNIKDYGEIDLKGSDKSKQSGKCQLEMAEQIGKEIEKALKQVQGNIKNIVIVSNRSYANSFNILGGERDIGISGSEQIFEENGYMYIDYNKNKKIIKPKATILQVTPQNYKELKLLFPDIPHSSIIEFQNKVNVHFIQKQELFEECISKDNINLQIFCLVNLLKKSRFDVIHKNRTLLKNSQIKQSLIQANSKYEIIVNYYENVYPNVSEVRGKSLDERIRKGEDIKPFFTLSNEEYKDINELKIITEGKPIKYIQGNAGNGKSFLLTQIAEKIHKYNTENINTLKVLYHCNYINLSGGGLDKLNNIEFKNGYENILLIDSIDESRIILEERKKLDSRLLELSKNFKIIITSRNGYLYEYNGNESEQGEILDNNQEIIELKDFNEGQIDDYLNVYFGEDEKKIKKVKKILSNLNGIGNNPLILYMICELLKEGELKNIDIEEISIIDIYDKIIKRRVSYGNNKNKNRGINTRTNPEDIINTRIEFLSKIGYKMLIEGRNIIEEEIDLIIKSKKEYPDRIHQSLESLELLFKRNKGGQGGYDFIHQSFKEYFAAKRLFEKIKEKKLNLKKEIDFIIENDFHFTGIYEEIEYIDLLSKENNDGSHNFPYMSFKDYFNAKKIFKNIKRIAHLEFYNYKIINFLIDLIKNNEEMKIICIDCINYINTKSGELKGKLIYILGKLDPDKENGFSQNDSQCVFGTGWDFEIIEGMIKLRTEKNINLIKEFLIKLVNKDNEKEEYSKKTHYINIIELFISEGLEKEVFDILYNNVYLKNNLFYFNNDVFDILYRHVENKAELIKNIFSKIHSLDSETKEHIYKIIFNNHIDDLEYIFGGNFQLVEKKIKDIIREDTIKYKKYNAGTYTNKNTLAKLLINIEDEINDISEGHMSKSKSRYDYAMRLQKYEGLIFELKNYLDVEEFNDKIKTLFNRISYIINVNNIEQNSIYSNNDRYYELIFTIIKAILKNFSKENLGFLDDFIEKNKKELSKYGFFLVFILSKYGKTKLQAQFLKYLIFDYNEDEGIQYKIDFLSNIPEYMGECIILDAIGMEQDIILNHEVINPEVANEMIKLCLEENKEEDIKYFIPNYVCITDL